MWGAGLTPNWRHKEPMISTWDRISLTIVTDRTESCKPGTKQRMKDSQPLPTFPKKNFCVWCGLGVLGRRCVGGTTIVFIQKAKYFQRENTHLSALPLRSEHLDTSTFHKLNKTPTTVHQIKLKGLHRVCAVWTPPHPHHTQSAARCHQRSIVLTVPAHAHSLLKTLHCSYWKATSACPHTDLSFSFFSFN